MIRGVLIPFGGEYDMKELKELENNVQDKIGFCAQIVEMDENTYDDICVEDES